MGVYRRLKVWQAAQALAVDVYRVTKEWPTTDRFSLGDQMRRAAISIGANIAEGCGRNVDAEMSRFVSIALGSANELHSLLQLAVDVDLLASEVGDRLQAQAGAICRMLSALHRATSSGTSKRKRPAEAGRLPN